MTKQAADTTPPVLNLPSNITAEATGPNGASVTFDVSATNNVDGTVTPNCTIQDTTPPILTVPANITVSTSDPTGTNVSYSTSATDLVDGTLTPVCTPASGSLFGPGTTEVSCSATDSHGNTGSAAFTVTVEIEAVVDRAPPLVSAVTAVPDAAPTNTEVTLTAIVDDTTTGGSQIIAADYTWPVEHGCR